MSRGLPLNRGDLLNRGLFKPWELDTGNKNTLLLIGRGERI